MTPVCARAIVVDGYGYERDSITYRGQNLLHTKRRGKFHYDGTPLNPPRSDIFGWRDPTRLILPTDPDWDEAVEKLHAHEALIEELHRKARERGPLRPYRLRRNDD